MPSSLVTKISTECSMSIGKAEELWKKAEDLAGERGLQSNDKRYYPYVVGILKNMVGKECLGKLGWSPPSNQKSEAVEIQELVNCLSLKGGASEGG